MISDYTYEDLYQMYLNRQWQDVETIVQDTKVYELKQFAKDNSLVWYQGSKASFPEQLRINLVQSRIIRGEHFK